MEPNLCHYVFGGCSDLLNSLPFKGLMSLSYLDDNHTHMHNITIIVFWNKVIFLPCRKTFPLSDNQAGRKQRLRYPRLCIWMHTSDYMIRAFPHHLSLQYFLHCAQHVLGNLTVGHVWSWSMSAPAGRSKNELLWLLSFILQP